MWKKIFATAFVSLMLMNSAAAELDAAREYREIFRGGNFYLEFKDKWGTRIIVGSSGTRMERMNYTFDSGAMAWLNPLGAIFGGTGDKNPEVMHKDGKYYHFVSKRKVNVCSEENLHDENLDPRQGWNKISQKLAVPEELAVFFWDDPYRAKSSAISAPKFSESVKKILDGKQYDCDRYVSSIRQLNGSSAAHLVYDMIYRDGQLFLAQMYIVRNGTVYPVSELEVIRIQREIPKNTFKIYKGTKLYAAGVGDIDDLLENPREIGTMEDA